MKKTTHWMRLLGVLLALVVFVGMGCTALFLEEDAITAPQQAVQVQAAASRGGVHPASSVLHDSQGVTPAAQDAAIQSGNGLTVAHDNPAWRSARRRFWPRPSGVRGG